MGSLRGLIEKYARGQATAEEVVSAIARGQSSPTPHHTFDELIESPDPDEAPAVIEGTWQEVDFAWFQGVLTDQQYWALDALYEGKEADGERESDGDPGPA